MVVNTVGASGCFSSCHPPEKFDGYRNKHDLFHQQLPGERGVGLLVLGEVKLWEVELAILILVTSYYVVVIIMRVLMPHLIMIITSN